MERSSSLVSEISSPHSACANTNAAKDMDTSSLRTLRYSPGSRPVVSYVISYMTI
ncbi:MAG: hypothetical protein H0U65_14710 [Rubrobacter sp.]|nr:hypothetical protein [Rubrobacter sp.]